MAGKELHLVFHLPADGEALGEIRRRIARVQAEAVLRYVDSLPIPLSRKQKLVDDIVADANARAARVQSPFPEDVTIVWEKSPPGEP